MNINLSDLDTSTIKAAKITRDFYDKITKLFRD